MTIWSKPTLNAVHTGTQLTNWAHFSDEELKIGLMKTLIIFWKLVTSLTHATLLSMFKEKSSKGDGSLTFEPFSNVGSSSARQH